MLLKAIAILGTVVAATFGAVNLGLGGPQTYSITGHFLSPA